MRTAKVLFVIAIAVFALSLTPRVNTVSAQQIPACTDKTNLGTILAALSVGPFGDALKTLPNAATPDDFATIIDLGIQARHAIMDLKIDPTADQGCFYLQLSGLSLANDEIDVATYQSFIKAGLKAADAYQKGLTDAQARLQKDAASFQALAQIGAGTPAPTAAS